MQRFLRHLHHPSLYSARMQVHVDEVSVAFTYAWWLTGDDAAAEAAVRQALGDYPDDGNATARLGSLLRAVRAAAAPEPTMCPASEVALLHDAHAIPLDLAADLVCIPAEEARTELAHGRLEALVESPERLLHPERLGGLAVGNPPDVAHTRTCDSCATVRELLRRGREELISLPQIPVPDGLLADLADAERAHLEDDYLQDGASDVGVGVGHDVGFGRDRHVGQEFAHVADERGPVPADEYAEGYPDEHYADDVEDSEDDDVVEDDPRGGRLLSFADLRALDDQRTSGDVDDPAISASPGFVLGGLVVLVILILLIVAALSGGGGGGGGDDGADAARSSQPAAAGTVLGA